MLTNRWKGRMLIAIGVLVSIFGSLIVFASYEAILQLSQALDLCTSTLACPGTLSGGSVYGNIYSALLWDVLTLALGLGIAAGGFVLALNAARTKDSEDTTLFSSSSGLNSQIR